MSDKCVWPLWLIVWLLFTQQAADLVRKLGLVELGAANNPIHITGCK